MQSTRRPSGPLVSVRATPASTRHEVVGSSGWADVARHDGAGAAQPDVQLLWPVLGLVVAPVS